MTEQPEQHPHDRHLAAVPTSGAGKKAAAAVRANRAVELVLAGATLQQVADALGYKSKSSAHAAVQRGLQADTDRMADSRDEARTLQHRRCERLLRAIWPKALSGDLGAVDRALRILERESKLLGLDAPVQIAVNEDKRAHIESMVDSLEALFNAPSADPDR